MDYKFPSQEEVVKLTAYKATLMATAKTLAASATVGSATATRMGPQIGIQNLCTVVSDADVSKAVAALQIQLDRDWQPAWGTTATLTFYNKNQTVPQTSWIILIMDNSDITGALGYHDENASSRPYGKVFVKDAIRYGYSWTVTLSHELLEMMADPFVNLTVFRQTSATGGRLYAYESCDAVENDRYGYRINNILVSDFQYPAWFDATPRAGSKFDHMGYCTTSYQILPGGYMPIFNVNGGSGWQSLNELYEIKEPDSEDMRNRRFSR